MKNSYKTIQTLPLGSLEGKKVIFMDCEYMTKGMPGKERPDTLNDHIELAQISGTLMDLKTGAFEKYFDVLVKPKNITPLSSKETDFKWFEEFTGIKVQILMDKGVDLKEAIEALEEAVDNHPIVIMKGDAEVIFNDTQRRLGLGYNLNSHDNVFVLSRYLKEIFDVLGIEKSEMNLNTCSGDLHLLLKNPLKSKNTHNALHDSKSMGWFLWNYFQMKQ